MNQSKARLSPGTTALIVTGLLIGMLAVRAEAGLTVPMAVDNSQTTAQGWGGSPAGTLNDTFLYDPNNPASASPVQVYSGGLGFHSNNNTQDNSIGYVFPNGTRDRIALDIWGRDTYYAPNSEVGRHQNLTIELFHGNWTTPVHTTTGFNGVSGSPDYYGRYVAPSTVQADRAKITRPAGDYFVFMEARAVTAALPVEFQSATATYDQGAPYTAGTIVDGNLGNNNGWGVYNGQTSPQTAIITTATTVNADELRFELLHLNQHSSHAIKQFRLSATTDATPTLGGTWTELTPVSFWTTHAGTTLSDAGGNQVLSSGGGGGTRQNYFVSTTNGGLSDITGFRLEVLPVGGTIGYAGNGNFVLTEFRAGQTAAFATQGTSDTGLAFGHSGADLLTGLAATSSLPIFTGTQTTGTAELTNGLGTGRPGTANDRRTLATDTTAPWVLTYDLGLDPDSAAEIETIRVFSHNTDGRVFQDYDVEVSSDGVSWSILRTDVTNGAKGFDFNLASGTSGDYLWDFGATEIAELDGSLLTTRADDVKFLRFTFHPVTGGNSSTLFAPGGAMNYHTSLYEIDVIGQVSIPEPATVGLLAAGAAGLGGYVRRRRRR